MTISLKSNTGITDHTVQLYTQDGTTQGSSFNLPELIANTGLYAADPPSGTPKNRYFAVISRPSGVVEVKTYDWDGEKEITNLTIIDAISQSSVNISAGPTGNGLDFIDLEDSLRYVDPALADAAGITITAEISSMSTNRARRTVQLSKVRGGWAGDFPDDLPADIYAIRYTSNDGQVDAYEEFQTTLTPLGARIERVVTLVEADEVRINNTYRKLQKGTTQVLLQKERTVNGTTVEIREQ